MAIVLRPQLKAELRRQYGRLKAVRGSKWRTVEGQHFLHELAQHADKYGHGQLAGALEVSPQAVRKMLRAYDPTRLFSTLRTTDALIRLQAAYEHVKKWREMGRQVRKTHESFRRMNDAVTELAMIYEIPTIAKLSGLRAQELHRFMDDPEGPTYDDVALLSLVDEYDGGRALTGPKRRAFLAQLEETLALLPLVDVARVLNVSPRVVRTWMVEQAHGQHPPGPAGPRS
jgi:hypothetical protein